MTIAGLDEVRHLLRRLGVDDPAKSRRLSARHTHHATMVRNHADLNTANTRVAREHLFRIIRLKLVEMSAIKQTSQQLSHVIRLTMIFGNEIVEFLSRSRRLTRSIVRYHHRGLRQLRHKLPDLFNAGLIVRNSIMGHPG